MINAARGMRPVWRWLRSTGRFHLLLPLILVAANAAAEPPGPVLPPPVAAASPPRSAEADAETYDRCMKLARENPHEAQTWLRHGLRAAGRIRPIIAPQSR